MFAIGFVAIDYELELIMLVAIGQNLIRSKARNEW